MRATAADARIRHSHYNDAVPAPRLRRRLMRPDGRREPECLGDAVADTTGLVALGIRSDVHAVEAAGLPDPRFDLRARQLVLDVREEILRVRIARERTELHG